MAERLTKADLQKRIGFAQAQLSLLFSDEEIVSALVREFNCSPRLAKKWLQAARGRSVFAKRDKRAFQDTLAHGYAGLFRAALTKRGKAKGECPQCQAEVWVEVPKPSIGVAKGNLDSLANLWKAQATPEDLLSSDELRTQTVQAMLAEAERFATDELASMVEEFQRVIQRRQPAQMGLPLG